MGKLIVTEFVTLDGVAQAPGGPDEDPENGLFGGGGGGAESAASNGGSSVQARGEVGGGGGGSGFGPPDTQFESGVRRGDGAVTISYDPATDSCPPPAPEAAPIAIELVPRFTG